MTNLAVYIQISAVLLLSHYTVILEAFCDIQVVRCNY